MTKSSYDFPQEFRFESKFQLTRISIQTQPHFLHPDLGPEVYQTFSLSIDRLVPKVFCTFFRNYQHLRDELVEF